MIKDEYEMLAFNDLNVAHGYLGTLNEVMMSLNAYSDPRRGKLESAYLGLYEFAEKHRHRLGDISTISGKIEEARSRHKTVIKTNEELVEANAKLTKQLENARELCLELQADNVELTGIVSDLRENLKFFLPS